MGELPSQLDLESRVPIIVSRCPVLFQEQARLIDILNEELLIIYGSYSSLKNFIGEDFPKQDKGGNFLQPPHLDNLIAGINQLNVGIKNSKMSELLYGRQFTLHISQFGISASDFLKYRHSNSYCRDHSFPLATISYILK